MEYVIIGLVAVVAVVIMVSWWQRRELKQPQEATEPQRQETQTLIPTPVSDDTGQRLVRLEQLPVTAIPENLELVEIKDHRVLARIDNLVPDLLQAGNAARNAVQANGQVLYQAIIPAGAKLADSRDMAGAVRGIYHGADGIQGHANLVAVNNGANVVSNAAASAMGVASMVVGQYYMTQISAELNDINTGISKIADFQNNEYKSRVFALVAQIQKIAQFQVDILENEELRSSEINNLNRWETECAELLGQANLSLEDYSKLSNFDYPKYEKLLPEINNWYTYQNLLLELLVKISELRHTLHLGVVSVEQCCALIPTYEKQVNIAQAQLSAWHHTQIQRFGIKVEDGKIKRAGLDGFIHLIPGWINEEHKYRPISKKTVKQIISQTNDHSVLPAKEAIDLFQEDVRIVAKEGKLYYLPFGRNE